MLVFAAYNILPNSRSTMLPSGDQQVDLHAYDGITYFDSSCSSRSQINAR